MAHGARQRSHDDARSLSCGVTRPRPGDIDGYIKSTRRQALIARRRGKPALMRRRLTHRDRIAWRDAKRMLPAAAHITNAPAANYFSLPLSTYSYIATSVSPSATSSSFSPQSIHYPLASIWKGEGRQELLTPASLPPFAHNAAHAYIRPASSPDAPALGPALTRGQ